MYVFLPIGWSHFNWISSL